MRAFSPCSSSRALAAVGTGALLVLVIVVVTGGFVLESGPIYLSARRATGPLVLALLAWGGAALCGRAALRAAALSIDTFVERRAAPMALLLAAAVAGIGIACGTYAASSADAAGYVSQADLIAGGALVRDEPLAREVGWPQAEWTFSTLGYRPGPNPGEIVPTYPPGLPLVMASLLPVAGDTGPFLVVPLLGAIAVLSAYALGARLHSRTAGLVAAALLATSPILLFQLVQPMSDVPATAWWGLALVLALTPASGAATAAGAVSGLAVLTRPNLLPLAIAVALTAAGWPREPLRPGRLRPRGLVLYGAGFIPALIALAVVNTRLYGSAFASGYGGIGDLFALGNVTVNLRGYAGRLLHGEMPLLVLAACALAAMVRLKPEATVGLRTAARLAGLVAAILLVSYLPYGAFEEWSYLRFLLPAFPIVCVAVGAGVAVALRRLPEGARGLTLLTVMTVVCSLNVTVAAREQAFNLRRYEARYRIAGRYLAATLPSNAVVIAVQESASARYYTGLPVLRWDLLPVDLDTAIARLRVLGRHPVILIEEWEMGELASKFPGSVAARLDWRPRLDVGDETRVKLFDPADRAATTDRLHSSQP